MRILLLLRVFLVEAFSLGMLQVMAVGDAVHAIDRLGVHPHQVTLLRQQVAQVVYMCRWYPDGWDHVGCQHPR